MKVLEMRQLYEEEGRLLERTVESMKETFAQIVGERTRTGVASTGVDLVITNEDESSSQVLHAILLQTACTLVSAQLYTEANLLLPHLG